MEDEGVAVPEGGRGAVRGGAKRPGFSQGAEFVGSEFQGVGLNLGLCQPERNLAFFCRGVGLGGVGWETRSWRDFCELHLKRGVWALSRPSNGGGGSAGGESRV